MNLMHSVESPDGGLVGWLILSSVFMDLFFNLLHVKGIATFNAITSVILRIYLVCGI